MSQTLSVATDETRGEERAAVSIVIPVLNEEAIIDENLATLAEFFDSVVGSGQWIFIIVDNGSTDATPAKIQAAIARWPLSRVVNLPEPNYGAALRAGLTSAKTRWTYLIDIEQWDLPFIAWSWKHRDTYDMFLASKRSDPTINFQTPYRRVLSCCLNGLLQALLGFSGTDTHGPKLIDRASLENIIALCRLDRGQFDTELVLRSVRAQKRLLEIPVAYSENRPNRNWMVKKIIWNLFALRRLVKVMKDVPYEGLIRYHRLGREDILNDSEVATPSYSEPGHV
jgi:glycosyltransferase involved in cell wall biosynthesis